MEPAVTRISTPHHVVHRAFAAETVLLNIQTGQYHGLDPVAGRMFAVLLEVGGPAAAVAPLAEEFGVDRERIATDLAAFVEGLEARGLIEVHRDGSS